jgi:hypothetical protein
VTSWQQSVVVQDVVEMAEMFCNLQSLFSDAVENVVSFHCSPTGVLIHRTSQDADKIKYTERGQTGVMLSATKRARGESS